MPPTLRHFALGAVALAVLGAVVMAVTGPRGSEPVEPLRPVERPTPARLRGVANGLTARPPRPSCWLLIYPDATGGSMLAEIWPESSSPRTGLGLEIEWLHRPKYRGTGVPPDPTRIGDTHTVPADFVVSAMCRSGSNTLLIAGWRDGPVQEVVIEELVLRPPAQHPADGEDTWSPPQVASRTTLYSDRGPDVEPIAAFAPMHVPGTGRSFLVKWIMSGTIARIDVDSGVETLVAGPGGERGVLPFDRGLERIDTAFGYGEMKGLGYVYSLDSEYTDPSGGSTRAERRQTIEDGQPLLFIDADMDGVIDRIETYNALVFTSDAEWDFGPLLRNAGIQSGH